MEKIIYSESFYVNDFPNKDVDYAKGYIEAFMKKPPKKLFDYLNEQQHFGKLNPEFQAVIIGEPKGALFGKAQAAVLIVHSNFIAYTTTSDYSTPIGINYGYATFDNQLSITRNQDQLEMQIPYETFVFGAGSISQKEDFKVLQELLVKNSESVQLFYEVLPERDKNVKAVPTPVAAALPTEIVEEEPIVESLEEPVVEEEEQEWGHILMDENRQGEMEERKHLPAEQKEQLPAEQKYEEPQAKPEAKQEREMKTEEPVLDKRFDTKGPIISNNSIPKGFVFHEPVVYAESVRPGLFKTVTARAGYLQAYNACLDDIRDDIATGKFDAVFNLTFTAQSVENYFDVVVTGDAVVFDK